MMEIALRQILRARGRRRPPHVRGNKLIFMFRSVYNPSLLIANLVFIPLAGKLGIYSKAEATIIEMIVEGVCSIADGDNPTVVREKMQAFISESRREEVKATV